MLPEEDLPLEYNCNGSQTSFPITFTFDDDSEILAWIRNVSAKTQSPLVNPDDFSVVGKNLVTVDTWETGYKIIIMRDTEQSQTLYLEEYGPLPSKLLEKRLDKLTAMVQELQRKIGERALLLPETYTGSPIAFPEPENKYFLQWMSGVLTNVQHVAGTAQVTALMATLLAIASATDKDLLQYDGATASWLVKNLTEIFGAKANGNEWRHDKYTDANAVTAMGAKVDSNPLNHDKAPQWYKIADPPTGWLASKTAGWTADSFSGGLEVDFSSKVPAGTLAVMIYVYQEGTGSNSYWRKSGDTNISNTPNASQEYTHRMIHGASANTNGQFVVWLSSDLKAQFAVASTGTDLYISEPLAYYLP